jgi:formylglycine-generating enzyme required for sulfatase activity
MKRFAIAFLSLIGPSALVGCDETGQIGPGVVVSMSPMADTVRVGETLRLMVTVTGVENGSVTFEVLEGSRHGTVTEAGLYAAPAVVPDPARASVRARSVADTTKFADALLAIAPLTPVDPAGLVRIPAGSFEMGNAATSSDGEGTPCGFQRRTVVLTRAFDLGQTEVTNQQYVEALQWAYQRGYVALLGSVVYDRMDGRVGREIALLYLEERGSEIDFIDGLFALRDASHGINPTHPVKVVTWYGAAAFCDWLSMKEGLPQAYDHRTWECNAGDPYRAEGYRLPADAEWEYAAQYNDARGYPWGWQQPDCLLLNFGSCYGWSMPVGSYPAENWIGGIGLYDVGGNVSEWINDWFECNLGTADVVDPAGPSSARFRVVRGGNWATSSRLLLRCASRSGGPPSGASRWNGFRIAKTAAYRR